MAEDAIGFLFWQTEDGRTIANDNAVRNASEHLSWPNGTFPAAQHYRALDNIGRAVEVIQDRIGGGRDAPEPVWDDNVPPDGSDFLL